jgi:tetratricopeptide (TPR) repeat protein
MYDPELPFNPDSVSRLISAPRLPDPEVVALTKLGCWGLSHLSSTLSIDGRPRLVGRELESVRLLHAIDSVGRENGAAAVTISGVAGSGKSRLVEELLTVAEAAGFEGRIFSVAAEAGDGAYATIRRLLNLRLGLDNKGEGLKRDCLVRRVSELFDDQRVEDVCYFLGGLVGVEVEPSPLARMLSQQPLQAEMALETLIRELFAADCERAPLCLVIEDLQHLDRESLRVLLSLSDDLRPGALLIACARPEFFTRNERFADDGDCMHEHLQLGPLDDSDVRTLVRQTIGDCTEGGEALQAYVLQAGLGNPGLIQELVREVWAFGALQENPDGSGCRFDASRLPDAQASSRLVATEVRLSCMPSMLLAVLEAGAVAGNVCWAGMWPALLRVSCPDVNLDEGSISLALYELERRGHLLRLPDSRIEGEIEYVFRDPAERERLAAQVTPRLRRELHRAIADFLAPREEAQIDSLDLAVLLARHLTHAGWSFRAALAYLKAAEISRRESDALQASVYFELGLRALGDQDNRRRLDVLHDYGALLVELGRPGRARPVFLEMATLAERMSLPAKLGAALNRLARIQRESGELLEAEQTLRQALAAFTAAVDARGMASTKDDLGKVLWLLGDRSHAIPLLREALEERKRIGNERSLAVSLSNLAVVWEDQGRSATSERALGIIDDIAERADDVAARCDALLARGLVVNHRHDNAAALSAFRRATELAYAAKDRPRLARSLIQLGLAELRQHDYAKAEELLVRGSSLAREMQCLVDVIDAERGLAKLALKCARLPQARTHICRALRLARRVKSRPLLIATMRTFADVVGRSERRYVADRAVGYYVRSIELCKELGDERELAKGYRSFARYAERFESGEIRQQRDILRDLSDEIFRRYESQPVACA